MVDGVARVKVGSAGRGRGVKRARLLHVSTHPRESGAVERASICVGVCTVTVRAQRKSMLLLCAGFLQSWLRLAVAAVSSGHRGPLCTKRNNSSRRYCCPINSSHEMGGAVYGGCVKSSGCLAEREVCAVNVFMQHPPSVHCVACF